MEAHEILLMVEFAIVIGIAGWVIAERLGIPAIVVLMGLGIVVGPEALNLVDPAALGDALGVLVSIAVGIIVFEGGMLLDLDEMRAASPPIRNLITVGVFVAVVGGTLVAWLIAGLPLELALLFGALMCVTGPTVVTPLLKRAKVNRRLETILQSEAVLVDAIGAVLAVVALEIVIEAPEAAFLKTIQGIGIRLGAGTIVGLAGGWFIVYALRRLATLSAGTVRLAALAGALGVFALAEFLSPDAGIAAVALAGIVVGNRRIPYHDEIKDFKNDLTNLGIVVLFVLLSAGLRFESFTAFSLGGWGGVLAVAALMVIVRPLSVFTALFRTGVSRKEKFYIAALGPRGVVAAAIALFAELELLSNGYAGTGSFVGLVFMTIVGTVVIQGLAAAPLARRLGVTSMNVVIISADAIGRALARRLIDNGMSATMVDTDIIQVNLAREAGLNAHQGDGTDSDDLKRAGIEGAKSFVAATSSDRTNLLACQIAMHRFGLEDLVARVNNPDQLETFKALGIRVVSPVVSTAVLLDSLVRQSSTLEMMYNQVPGQEVFEVTLNCKRLIEKPLREWDLQGDVLVALVRRNGSLFVPHGNTVMKRSDILTLMGVIKDVERARQMCEDE